MGTAIHFHTEVKVNGRWEHYSHPQIDRTYWLFTLLCNVRCREYVVPFLDEPNYIWPDDLNIVTAKALDLEEQGYHSLCTFDSKTIHEFYNHIREMRKPASSESLVTSIEGDFLGYLEGNDWDIIEYSADKPEWVEDVRWVFAFDC